MGAKRNFHSKYPLVTVIVTAYFVMEILNRAVTFSVSTLFEALYLKKLGKGQAVFDKLDICLLGIVAVKGKKPYFAFYNCFVYNGTKLAENGFGTEFKNFAKLGFCGRDFYAFTDYYITHYICQNIVKAYG